MTFTTTSGNIIKVESPDPIKTLLELYPNIKIKEDEPNYQNT